MIKMLKSLWRYRFFISTSIISDFRTKFARSKLGAFWLILSPLAQVLMYAVVLSGVLSSKMPNSDSNFSYSIYLLTGILFWSLLSELIVKSSTLFIDNSNLIKKIVFPKLALPSILVGVSLINNFILLFSILIFLPLLGNNLGMEILWIFPLMIMTTAMGLGLGLILGILNVFIRDIGQTIPIFLQFSFWFTPIVYPLSIVPDKFKFFLNFNPFYHLVSCYHDILYVNQSPNPLSLFISASIAMFLLTTALFLFKRSSAEVVDAL